MTDHDQRGVDEIGTLVGIANAADDHVQPIHTALPGTHLEVHGCRWV